MFQEGVTIDAINKMCQNTLVEHLGIEVTELGKDYIIARMPVDHRTHQPMGLLHGGASVVLAETLGSIAASLTLNQKLQHCVGLEVNANHVKSVKSGNVFGKTRPIHLGKRTQIWEITITNDQDELVCISRLTMAVIDKKN
ncbi:hotdog fold thioesterase [Roseivirga sp. E12]|uniref:hotdog fold thioesterase n=1 Tax=Roseivirga sp. E12 TaxID=2819237 RepID=UPI001ABC54E8|nr:hotdog fold thioesterase [Roseivirga sp. E12]MBO3700492.1 hotdog fold thioesterase [Roseivirga sp. E12]